MGIIDYSKEPVSDIAFIDMKISCLLPILLMSFNKF